MVTYTSMKASPEAVTALRHLALRVSAQVGRRVNMSDTLAAACAVAAQHEDEMITALAAQSGDEQ